MSTEKSIWTYALANKKAHEFLDARDKGMIELLRIGKILEKELGEEYFNVILGAVDAALEHKKGIK